MPTKPIAEIEELIGSRQDARGLQFAHIIAVKFYEDPALAWLRPLLPDVNADINFAVLPESERGNAILGAATSEQQNGWQDAGFYAIAYDWNGETNISYPGTDHLNPFDDSAQGLDF